MNTFQLVIIATALAGSGAFIIALINALFKDVFAKMINFLISTVFQHKNVADSFSIVVLNMYLQKHAKSWGISEELYDMDRRHIRSEGRERVTVTRHSSQSYRLFLYHGAPILFIPEKQSNSEDLVSRASFRFLSGTVNWEKLLVDAAKHYDSCYVEREPGRNYRVIRHVGTNRYHESNTKASIPDSTPSTDEMFDSTVVPINYEPQEVGVPQPYCSMDNIALSKDMEKIVKDVRFWMKNREWYSERDITWRRGYMLHGPAGCGKTSLIRAIAEDLDLPVHIFDLSSMDNAEFSENWNATKSDIPRCVVFEDFDTVFHGRTNVCTSSDLTFDTILNSVDGLEREDGLLLFVTTNHVKHIDEALGVQDENGMSSRPGRIDKVAKIGKPDYAGRYKIALRILKDPGLAKKCAIEGKTDSGAQAQERATQTALNLLWGNEE